MSVWVGLWHAGLSARQLQVARFVSKSVVRADGAGRGELEAVGSPATWRKQQIGKKDGEGRTNGELWAAGWLGWCEGSSFFVDVVEFVDFACWGMSIGWVRELWEYGGEGKGVSEEGWG